MVGVHSPFAAAGTAQLTATALTPDQLLPYVRAVSGLESRACGMGVLHHGGGQGVLVVFTASDFEEERHAASATSADGDGGEDSASPLDLAVAEALDLPGLERLTVLAATRPAAAPPDADCSRDAYWFLPLPLLLPGGRPGQKLRNVLRRSGREARIEQSGGADAWSAEHAALAEAFIAARRSSLDEGSIALFRSLGAYLGGAPEARLFSARDAGGRLLACAIGDYSSFATAFYMFAFRRPDAPPGTADALLAALAAEGAARGQTRLNLGLGIGPGVAFFKKKWGAVPALPCVETCWSPRPAKRGWFGRLFGR